MQAQEFTPDWFSAPHETICDLLEQKNISHEFLASMLEISLRDVDAILLGEVRIDESLAQKLHGAFGCSKAFWLQRQTQFDDGLKRAKANFDVAQIRALKQAYPSKELSRVGYRFDPDDDFTPLLKFFDVSTPNEWECRYQTLKTAVAFRKSETFENSVDKTLLWLRQAERKAELIKVSDWNKTGLIESLERIKRLTWTKQPQRFFPELQKICASVGVAVVAVRTPSKSPCSGATFFSASGKPVVVLSFRHKSDDHFWFSFFHEVGHLILHSNHSIFLEGIQDQPFEREESEANNFASKIIIPNQFAHDFEKLSTDKDAIINFAKKVGVCAGVVVGQLQHRRRIGFNQLNHLKRRYSDGDINTLF